MTGDLAIQARGLTKSFGSLVANDAVDLSVRPKTVHAVIGENGAGKSTLLRVLNGEIRSEGGHLAIGTKEIDLSTYRTKSSMAVGIGMVHQHFMLIPTFTVVDNILLGREVMRSGALDRERVAREVEAISKTYGLAVDPWSRVFDLSVGEQQRVALAKILWQGSDILLLDEPTAVLSKPEVEDLFRVLRKLVARGSSVVLVTHKLDEVEALADDITVMRNGKVVYTAIGDLPSSEVLARAMVGHNVKRTVAAPRREVGKEVLQLREVDVAKTRGGLALAQVSLCVREGEILGVAGVEGNGQTELQECIVGLRPLVAGDVLLRGESMVRWSVAKRYQHGLAYIPEDRLVRGLVAEFSIEENLMLGRQNEASQGMRIDRRAWRARALQLIEEADIRPANPKARVETLSGGNQQKVVVARELSRPNTSLLVCAQPTRGVDIGAVHFIHAQILKARASNVAVLLLSAELTELLTLSDRLVVLYRGRIVRELSREQLQRDEAREMIGAAMAGVGA